MLWSPIDVAALFREAGISGKETRQVAVALCWAESHGNDQAMLDNTTLTPPGKGKDRGLMQINSFWHAEVTDACAFDPVCNIKEAVRIFREWGNSWNAWAAYTNGAYLKYMELASVAVDAEIRIRKGENLAAAQAAQIANLQADLTSAMALQADLQGQLSSKSAELAQCQAQAQALTTQVMQLSGEKQVLQSQVTTLKASETKLKADVANLSQQLAAANAAKTTAESAAATANAKLELAKDNLITQHVAEYDAIFGE